MNVLWMNFLMFWVHYAIVAWHYPDIVISINIVSIVGVYNTILSVKVETRGILQFSKQTDNKDIQLLASKFHTNIDNMRFELKWIKWSRDIYKFIAE